MAPRTRSTAPSRKPVGRPPRKQRPAGLAAHATGGALVTIAERIGSAWQVAEHACSVTSNDAAGRRRGSGKGRSQAGRGVTSISRRTCLSLAALGNTVRARILVKLLREKATYNDLQKATKLQAGPLYHHINQLRMAGLIGPKQRDTYELTRGGRNLIMIIAAAAPLIRNGRLRPGGKQQTRTA